eukprot:scaffold12548_cov128-Isochrysis_galbana.AAC.1
MAVPLPVGPGHCAASSEYCVANVQESRTLAGCAEEALRLRKQLFMFPNGVADGEQGDCCPCLEGTDEYDGNLTPFFQLYRAVAPPSAPPLPPFVPPAAPPQPFPPPPDLPAPSPPPAQPPPAATLILLLRYCVDHVNGPSAVDGESASEACAAGAARTTRQFFSLCDRGCLLCIGVPFSNIASDSTCSIWETTFYPPSAPPPP